MSHRTASALASLARGRQVPWEHRRAQRVLSASLQTRAARSSRRPLRIAIAASCVALFVGVGLRAMSMPDALANAGAQSLAHVPQEPAQQIASAGLTDGGYARD